MATLCGGGRNASLLPRWKIAMKAIERWKHAYQVKAFYEVF